MTKGYNQREGLDYKETFSPMAKLSKIHYVITVAAQKFQPLYQLDVNNAFPNGDLFEEVYMELTRGFHNQGERCNKVCRLQKSLYGVKQSIETMEH